MRKFKLWSEVLEGEEGKSRDMYDTRLSSWKFINSFFLANKRLNQNSKNDY